MRITYAVQTIDDPRVRAWFRTVGERLRTKKGIMIGGTTRHLGSGVFLVSVETVVDMTGFLLGPLMLILSGMAAWVLWESAALSNWLVGLGVAGASLVYLLVTPGLHRLLMRATLRKVVGHRVMVKPATEAVLWGLAHGKV